MRLVNGLWLGGLVVAGGSLVLAYGLAGVWQWAWVFAALSLGWWAGRARSMPWAPWVGMAGLVLGAAGGLWLGANPFWMLAVAVAVLIAWDMDGFVGRLGTQEENPLSHALRRQHLKALAAAVAAGIVLGVLALSLQMQLSFWVLAAVSVLLAISLSRAFAMMSR